MQQVEAARTASAVLWNEAGELEVLSLAMGGQTFALEAVSVREILDSITETVIPGAPALAAGVVNFRGKIIPVADLRLAFGMEPAVATKDSRIVVVEIELAGEATLVGLKTDQVYEVVTYAVGDSEEVPVVGLRWRRDYVRRLVRRNDDVVVLLDLDAIFATITAVDAPAAAR